LWRFGVGHRAPQPRDDELLQRAVDAARDADAAIVIVGATDDHEVEGLDRVDLRLPGRQDELVTAIAAVNPNTVAVVNAGSVYTMPWADEVAAILWAGMPGQEAGHALADVLAGVLEPWGRLPTTMPRADGAAPIPSTTPVDGVLAYGEGHAIGYRGYRTVGAPPQFAFGHGLGYTSWSFETAELSPDGTALTVTVRNTGQRPGREVVQVYYQPDDAGVRLVGFSGVVADPGARATVTVGIDARAAGRWDVDASAWTPLVGGELRAGRSSSDLPLVVSVDRPLGT
jgi:beta-glucosidase